MKDTLELFGSGSYERVALRAGIPLAGIFLIAYLYGVAVAAEKAQWLLVGTIVSVGAFFTVLALYFVATPHRFDRDLATERDAAQHELTRWRDMEAVGRRLEALWRRGDALRRASDRDAAVWKNNVIAWFAEVDNSERASLPPHEQFALESHSSPPDPNDSPQEAWFRLDVRLGKLRLLVSRLLTPPRLRQDD